MLLCIISFQINAFSALKRISYHPYTYTMDRELNFSFSYYARRIYLKKLKFAVFAMSCYTTFLMNVSILILVRSYVKNKKVAEKYSIFASINSPKWSHKQLLGTRKNTPAFFGKGLGKYQGLKIYFYRLSTVNKYMWLTIFKKVSFSLCQPQKFVK